MVNRIFITLLFFTIFPCFLAAQEDSSRIYPIKIDLPEKRTTFSAIEKYGKEKKNWPVWLKSKVNEVNLNFIALDNLTIDGNRLNFNSEITYEKVNQIPGLSTYLQGNLKFKKTKDKYVFHSLNTTPSKESLELYYNLNDGSRRLFELNFVRENFKNSFNWRDFFPNQLSNNFSDRELSNLVLVSFINELTNYTLEVYFFKDKPVYLIQNIPLAEY